MASSPTQVVPVLARLRRLASPTDGCVTTATLLAAEINEQQIVRLQRDGALTRVVRNVHVVGADALTYAQARRAVQLAAGPHGELSGRTAAEHRGLLPESEHVFEATVFSKRDNRRLVTEIPLEATGRAGFLLIRSSRWSTTPEDVDGTPTSTVARTLLRLAAEEGGDVAWKAWREADYLGVLDPQAAVGLCRSGVAGSTTLRRLADAMLTVRADGTKPATTAEMLLIEALLRRGMPRPWSNRPMRLDTSWYYPDVWFEKWGVVLESDGGVHALPQRAAEDTLRDAHMRSHGLHVRRFDRDETLADPDAQADLAIAWMRSLGVPIGDLQPPAAR